MALKIFPYISYWENTGSFLALLVLSPQVGTAASEAGPSHTLGHLVASGDLPPSLSREEQEVSVTSQAGPAGGVFTARGYRGQGCPQYQAHTKDGFTAGLDHPRVFLPRGKRTLQHLVCLPSSMALCLVKLRAQQKGLGKARKALGFLLDVALNCKY